MVVKGFVSVGFCAKQLNESNKKANEQNVFSIGKAKYLKIENFMMMDLILYDGF